LPERLLEMKVFFLGYPGNMGGANTECWHTVKLLRGAGVEVDLIPTWGSDPPFAEKLAAIGCTTHKATPDTLSDVPGLPGSIVIGMCNKHALAMLPRLRAMSCPLVWVNCMTFLFPQEKQLFREHGPADAFVFQSEFQRSELAPLLEKIGCTPSMGHLIHGAFDPADFPFEPRPHESGEPFVIGRLSRPDPDKWSSSLWPILQGVPYTARRACVMGWNKKTQQKAGAPPKWAECHPPQSLPVPMFLGRCHAMLGLNGGARENWPRVGLEAMACGVPIVAQNQWGWREMVDHGHTGYLAANDTEMQFYLAKLAYDDDLRQSMAAEARERLWDISSPEVLWPKWQAMLRSIGGD
jgi:hypothetical protein